MVCGVDVTLTINDRTACVATAWHYADGHAAPGKSKHQSIWILDRGFHLFGQRPTSRDPIGEQ